eukprot:1935630-Rhodomonas_salina.2
MSRCCSGDLDRPKVELSVSIGDFFPLDPENFDEPASSMRHASQHRPARTARGGSYLAAGEKPSGSKTFRRSRAD